MSADPTNAVRKRRMRQKRAKEGLTEVRVWLGPQAVSDLKMLSQSCGSRAAIEDALAHRRADVLGERFGIK